MKKLLLMGLIAASLVACNNSSESTENKKDSLDSAARVQKNNIDSSADRKENKIDSMTDRKKDSLDRLDSAKRARDTAKKRY